MAPLPHNPFKMLREKQGISQYELARRLKISKHAILRNEQGCFDNPLPVVLNYYVENRFKGVPHLSRIDLVEAYHDFQYETRKSNALLFGDNLIYQLTPSKDGGPLPVGIHPLAYLRTVYGLNPTQVSKMLCITQSVVVYFEKKSLSQKSVPAQLVRALQDADYTEQDIDALSRAYQDYRQWLRADKGLKLVTNEDDSNNDRPARTAV